MAERLRIGWRRHLRPTVLPEGGVLLEEERGLHVLRGADIAPVAALLDGSRTRADLLDTPPTGLEPAAVAALIERIDTAGLLTRHESVVDDDPARAARLALWDAAGVDALVADARLAAARIRLLSPDGLDATSTRTALAEAGLRVVDRDGEAADLAVVLCRDYRTPAVAAVARSLRALEVPWLPVRPGAREIWRGPVIEHRDGSPCWDCLVAALRANRPLVAGTPAAATSTTVSRLAGTGAALAAMLRIARVPCPRRDRLVTEDILTGEIVTHPVRHRPQCPTCGDAQWLVRRSWGAVDLRSRPAHHGYRVEEPVRVRDRHAGLVDPLTGVVRGVRRDPRGPEVLRSFRSGVNPAATGRDGTDALRTSLRGTTGGKGTTDIEAEVGALCEAVERYSGSWHGDEAVVRGSLRSLGADAMHPDVCRCQDPRQVPDRHRWNREHSPLNHVLEPFDVTEEMDWTPVWSLTDRRHRLLPTAMLYYGAPGPGSLAADSNGCAAGSSLEDAVLQGLLELVERDAVAIWWYNRGRVPGIDLDAADDPWIEEVRAAHRDLGREVWALDVSADLGAPVVVALSRRTGSGTEDIALGFGAHLDHRDALRRALCELNQSMPAYVDPDDLHAAAQDDPDLDRWLRTASTRSMPSLCPHPAAPLRTLHRRAAPVDPLAEVEALRARIEAAGCEVLVLDQTRPEVGLPVVRAIAPGLRPMHARFAPGRLYQVPVTLGRQPSPTPFAELNPLPVFL